MGRRTRSLLLGLVAAMLVGLTPSAALATAPPAVPGSLYKGQAAAGDGVKLFVRYESPDLLYVVHVNLRDGRVQISKKLGQATEAAHNYHIFPNADQRTGQPVPWGQRQRVTVSTVDNPNGSVTIRLWVDDVLWAEATDNGAGGVRPLRAGRVGLRSDAAEWTIDNVEMHRANTTNGRPTTDRLLVDRFSYPNGLVTNQHARSPRNRTWLVTSGSLFARDGRGWSGRPDYQARMTSPNPESRWHTDSTVFRMVTNRRDFGNVAYSLDLWTRGLVTAASQTAPPRPAGYPTGGGDVTVRRNAGRSKTHNAIAVSRRAFSRSGHVVLMTDNPDAAHLAAPALAGRLDAPILLTQPSALNRDTAAEIRRLRARTVHIVGHLSSSMNTALRNAGVTKIRRYNGSNAASTAAQVARRVGGKRVYLAVSGEWKDNVGISGAAAYERVPVMLTGTGSVPSVTTRAMQDLGITHVTILGTSVSAALVENLRKAGYRVNHGGFSRYSISRYAAQRQTRAGARPARLWVASGARQTDALIGGPAAKRNGGVALTLDGARVGDISHGDLAARGFESRHWQRYQRTKLRALQVIGDGKAVTSTVVNALTARVTNARP